MHRACCAWSGLLQCRGLRGAADLGKALAVRSALPVHIAQEPCTLHCHLQRILQHAKLPGRTTPLSQVARLP